MESIARHLALHGAVLLLIGLLCGAPYAWAIKAERPAQTIHAWRVAHASLPIGATLMLAVAALLPLLHAAPGLALAIAAALIVSGYAFAFALPLGASRGHRGLAAGGPLLAQLVYAGNLIGALASLLAAALLVVACALAI